MGRTSTIVTCEVLGYIHDRQPVIVPADLWAVWCDGMPEEAMSVLARYPVDRPVYHPVPKALGSRRNEGQERVRPMHLG